MKYAVTIRKHLAVIQTTFTVEAKDISTAMQEALQKTSHEHEHCEWKIVDSSFGSGQIKDIQVIREKAKLRSVRA